MNFCVGANIQSGNFTLVTGCTSCDFFVFCSGVAGSFFSFPEVKGVAGLSGDSVLRVSDLFIVLFFERIHCFPETSCRYHQIPPAHKIRADRIKIVFKEKKRDLRVSKKSVFSFL